MNNKFLEINTNEMEISAIANGRENENGSHNIMIETTEMHTKRENLLKFIFVSFFFKSILTEFGLMASTQNAND